MISCCAGFKKEAAEETESPCEQKIEEMMENDDTFTNGAPILSMIKLSQMMYEYSDIRQIVLSHDAVLNRDLNFFQRWRRGLVDFVEPELISLFQYDKQTGEEMDPQYDGASPSFTGVHLKKSQTAADLLKFIDKNRQHFRDESDWVRIAFVRDGNNSSPLLIESSLSMFGDAVDAEVIEFDDEFADQELLYAIVLNRTEKRITVVFRGSRTNEDWKMNLDLKADSPSEISDDENVKVHGGHADYIFGPSNEDKSKFEQIVHILEQLYATDEYKDYGMFVTGHSLGGSLSTLFAFALVRANKPCFIPYPITAITFASPASGNDEFNIAFKAFEDEGKIRQIRISNNDDIVVTSNFLYKHAGLNMNIFTDKRMDIGFGDVRETLRGDFDAHQMDQYSMNIFQEANMDVLKNSVEELYKEYVDDDVAESSSKNVSLASQENSAEEVEAVAEAEAVVAEAEAAY